MTDVVPNTMIRDRFLIVHEIHRGFAGELYLAVDQQAGKAVALKRISHGGNETLAAEFESEVQALGRLRHDVLPQIIDHFTDPLGLFLVLQYVSGDDLATRLESAQKPFPPSWVTYWADQLLGALNYVHNNKPPIFHLDIRPRTMKLSEGSHVALLDLGLSANFYSAIRSARGNANVPDRDGSAFTPLEVIQGAGADARSDLYSLSASFYYLLTGKVPVDAVSRAGSLSSGTGDPLAALHVVDPAIPAAISDVFMKALGVKPDDRYSSALEMQSDLRRAHSGISQSAVNTAVLDRREAGLLVGEGSARDQVPTKADLTPDVATLVMSDVEETVRLADAGNIEVLRSDFEPTIVMDDAGPGGSQRDDRDATQIMPDPNAETIAVVDSIGAEAKTEDLSSLQPTMPIAADEIRPENPETRIAVDLANSGGQTAGVSAIPAPAAVVKTGGRKSLLLPIIGIALGLFVLAGVSIAGFLLVSRLNSSAPVNAIPSTPANAEPAGQTRTLSATPEASPSLDKDRTEERPSATRPLNLQSKPDAARTPAPSGPGPAQPPREPARPKETKTPAPKNSPKPKSGDDRTIILQ